jgi:hypothetical protein
MHDLRLNKAERIGSAVSQARSLACKVGVQSPICPAWEPQFNHKSSKYQTLRLEHLLHFIKTI